MHAVLPLAAASCMENLRKYLGWVQSLDWTTGLTQTAKYNLFSAEQKLTFLISSVTSLTLLHTVSFLEFLEVKGHVHI